MGLSTSQLNALLPLDKSGIISTTMEAILYGFSLFMYGFTLWVLLRHKATGRINWPMVAVSTALFSFSTMHIASDTHRIIQGLIDHRDTPGGPTAWFEDVSTFTFVFKSAVYTFQTLTGDGVVVYRAYMVWRSLWVVLFGGIMLCGVAVTAVGSVYACSQASPTQTAIFLNQTGRWITSFYAATLAANFSCTFLLAYRIWVVNSRVQHYSTKSLMPVLMIIIDAGALYSVTLFTTLVSFVCHSNGQYIVVDMVMPIISIAFYMVIIRVGLAKGINPTTIAGDITTLRAVPLGTSYREEGIAMRPMEVRITQFVDKDDGLQQSGQRSRSPDTTSGKV